MQYQDLGIFRFGDLLNAGWSRYEINNACDTGRLQRVARGWYSSQTCDQQTQQAISAGGTIGCLSGCARYGLWTPNDHKLHVVLGAGIPHKPNPELVFHRVKRQYKIPLPPLEDCLSQVVKNHDSETALIVIESALNKRLIRDWQVSAIIAAGTVRKREQLLRFQLHSESGSETRVCMFLSGKRVVFVQQAIIPGIGRVDILVGKSLIIECDSASFHTSPDDYHRDRQRDANATRLGYRVVRLSYQQIWYEWEETKSYLLEVLRTKSHYLPPRPLAGN